jgi:hypothetical protein
VWTLDAQVRTQIWWGRRLTVSEHRCQDGTAQNGTVKMVLARSIPYVYYYETSSVVETIEPGHHDPCTCVIVGGGGKLIDDGIESLDYI